MNFIGGAVKGTGVIFLTVAAIDAILSPNDQPKNDSRTRIRFSESRSKRSCTQLARPGESRARPGPRS